MAGSRYDSAGSSDFWGVSSTNTTGPSSSVQDSTSTTNSNSSSSSNTNTSKQGTSTTSRMDPSSMAALQLLISQLLGGGTDQMAQDRAKRLQEISANQDLRGQYSKESAFADAQGAMNQLLRQAMEQSLPTLVRAAEGAGTSANSMRALLTQEAINRASESAAALGLRAASDYGTIGANYGNILERLTQPDNAQTQALINALNIAKGATETTNFSETGTSRTSGTQSSSSTQSGTSTTQNSGRTDTSTSMRGKGSAGSSSDFFGTPSAGGSLSGYSVTPGGLSGLSNAEWNAVANLAGRDVGWFDNSGGWGGYTDF